MVIIYADDAFYKDSYLQGKTAVITAAFPYFARLATAEIKRCTMNNVDESSIPEAVAMCCCEIAELAYGQGRLTGSPASASSESVQGWSKSYESADSRIQAYSSHIRECIYKAGRHGTSVQGNRIMLINADMTVYEKDTYIGHA